jgi:hypothetical protein
MYRKKPTGEMWYFISGQEAPVHTFSFPRTKEDIEKHILDSMLYTAQKAGLNPYNLNGVPQKKPENDFDFTIPTAAGDEELDLMEVAPLDVYGRTHETAPTSYVNGEFADIIMEKILSKSKGYGPSSKSRIHLLLYSTDWKFKLIEDMTDLLAYQCHRAGHCFRSIFYYAPEDEAEGRVVCVFPRPTESLANFDEGRVRRFRTFLAGPSNMELSDDGMTMWFTHDPIQKRE